MQTNLSVFDYERGADIEPANQIPGFLILIIWSLGEGLRVEIKEWKESRTRECSGKKRQESFFASRFAWSIAADWQARHLGLGNPERKTEENRRACSPQWLKDQLRLEVQANDHLTDTATGIIRS